MSTDLLRFLARKNKDEIDKMSDDLARGTAKDHGDYKYACGIVRGLILANTIIAETAERVKSND